MERGPKPPEWLPITEAAAHTGRSQATIKRLVAQGLVNKRLVPMPGRKPQAQVLLADLERHFSASVHVPAKAESPRAYISRSDLKAQILAKYTQELEAVFAKNGIKIRCAVEVKLRDKLTWTVGEARRMTGLSRPAIRQLLEEHPDLAIRRGQRVWIRAARLRAVLS